MSERFGPSLLRRATSNLPNPAEIFRRREKEYLATSPDFDFTQPARDCMHRIKPQEIDTATIAFADFLRELQKSRLDAVRIVEVREYRSDPMLEVTAFACSPDEEKADAMLEAIDEAAGRLAESTIDDFSVTFWWVQYKQGEDPQKLRPNDLISLRDRSKDKPLVFLRFQNETVKDYP